MTPLKNRVLHADTTSTTGRPTSPTDGAAADVGDLGSTTPDPKSQRRSVLRSVVVGAIRTSLTSLTALLPRAMPPAQPADSASRIRRAAIRPTARHRTSRQLPQEPAPAQSHSTTRLRTCSRRSTRSPNALRRPSSNSAHPGRTTRQAHRSTQRRRHCDGGHAAAATRPTPTDQPRPIFTGPLGATAEASGVRGYDAATPGADTDGDTGRGAR